jgi:4-alpha-glucanotransferase
VVAAPENAWGDRRERRWGVAAELAALRSERSRSVGDLRDLQALGEAIAADGGDLVSVLPILPTYDDPPIEPSPYSPVSRLFWSDLVLRLDDHPSVTNSADLLDFEAAGEEVRAALRGRTAPPPSAIDPELARYASFRGAQARLGRDWRTWPSRTRGGELTAADVDPDVERHHLVAQAMLRDQLDDVSARMADIGVELGLDLAVGVHPTGYDVWSRQALFAEGIEVGAPADLGFPSGQSWGFAPLLPEASRTEGYAYVAASVAHQAAVAGVLRIDHVMAMSRLYWIPSGSPLTEGTYVEYPTDEMFAVLSLESHRNGCCLVGENLGTVPADIDAALTRHGIWGMYLAQFAAGGGTAPMADPTPSEVAMIGTHDTPTLAGWLDAIDVGERIRMGLLDSRDDNATRTSRRAAAELLAEHVGASLDRPDELLDAVLTWLGESASPLVVVWLEDLWLEADAVNLPGTSSADRPNWQRPMARLLDDALADPEVRRRLQLVAAGRQAHMPPIDGSGHQASNE